MANRCVHPRPTASIDIQTGVAHSSAMVRLLFATLLLFGTSIQRAEETNSVANALSNTTLTGYIDTSAIWGVNSNATNLVANGSFEQPAYDFGYWVVGAGQNIGGWTVENGTIEVIHR